MRKFAYPKLCHSQLTHIFASSYFYFAPLSPIINIRLDTLPVGYRNIAYLEVKAEEEYLSEVSDSSKKQVRRYLITPRNRLDVNISHRDMSTKKTEI